MRLGRLQTDQGPRFAQISDGHFTLCEGTFPNLIPIGDAIPLDSTRLLAPIVPTKIVAVASNYPKHAAEMGKEVPESPRIFLKPPSAVIGPGRPIFIPPGTTRTDPEGELAIVMGRRADHLVPTESILDHIYGYTCGNDVTARDFQKADGIFGRGKGFDTFCPLGPWVITDVDPGDLAIHTAVNGEVRAAGRTSDMHFDIPTLLRFITNIMTLEPGDVILTGTPPGVGPVEDGDEIAVFVEGIGTLRNTVQNRVDRAAPQQ